MDNELDEIPVLLEMETNPEQSKRWKASPETEDAVLEMYKEMEYPSTTRASPEQFEEFYYHGYLLYKFGRYADAQIYFNVLTLGNPQNAKYLLALAACLHMQKDYVSAIQVYCATMFFDPDNPQPLYHAADCYIKLHQPFNAVIALEMAIEKCKDPKNEPLKDRMVLMVKRLGNELRAQMKESQESFISDSGRKLELFEGNLYID